MKKSEKINIVNYITIGGKKINMETLSDEEKREIAIRLNDIALTAAGYVRIDETA